MGEKTLEQRILTPAEIRKKFAVAFNQYATVDFSKCEHPGDVIVTGYFAYELDGRRWARPFWFTNEKERKEIEAFLMRTRMESLVVAFAQHYIIYA